MAVTHDNMKTNWKCGLMALALAVPLWTVAAGEPRTVQIAITSNGFEPSRVKVTTGEPLRLVVTRKTDDTCAKEIVIPEEHLRADLPLDRPVTLRFTPMRAGELRYACGMNMVTGVIEVASVGARETRGEDAQGNSGGGMMGGGMMMGGMMGGSMGDMRAIHGLLSQHDKIQRSVKDVTNGVETVTRSDDAEVTALIREHVWQMKSRIEDGRPIRQMDPLFREIFANHEHIHMQIQDVPGGVRVTETADEARIVPLVRQHARRAVSEFVSEGMSRAMRPTPLPPGYEPSQATQQHRRARRCGCWMST